MSLKRPRNIEIKTIYHWHSRLAELKTLLPDKPSLERARRIDDTEVMRLKMKAKARNW